jgi:hypothetical protein
MSGPQARSLGVEFDCVGGDAGDLAVVVELVDVGGGDN